MEITLHVIYVTGSIGFIMYVFNMYLDMNEPYKKVINTVVGVAYFLWILSYVFNYHTHLGKIQF